MTQEEEFAALYQKLLVGCFVPDPRRSQETLQRVLRQLFPQRPEPIQEVCTGGADDPGLPGSGA